MTHRGRHYEPITALANTPAGQERQGDRERERERQKETEGRKIKKSRNRGDNDKKDYIQMGE